MKKICSVIITFSMVFSFAAPVFAANGTWVSTGGVGPSWGNSDNWSSGTIPGATSGTTNTDTATFNTAITNTFGTSTTPIVIDSGRNIQDISFDTAAGNYYIGSTSLNPLLLTSGGTTQILNTLTSTNAIETINAPLVIEGAAGTYTFSNNSANGTGARAGTLNIGGSITGGAAGITVLTLSGSNTNANTISGIITRGSATMVSITKSGVGTWVLSGANTYMGATTINAGTLKAGIATQAFGLDSAVSVAVGGTMDLGGFNETIGSLTGGGTVTSSAAGTPILTTGADNSSTTFSGTIQNGSATSVGLTKEGNGTLTLSGPNTYSGTTTINNGTLEAGVVDQAFGLASAVSVAVGGTMDMGGFNETIGSLSGAGTVTNSGGSAAVLTTGADNTSTTFSGNIQDGASSVGLTKEGTGILILSGDNTYSGNTTLNGGTLNLGSSTAIGAGTINFNGGTLQYSASNTTDYSSQFSAADDQAFNIDTNSQDVTFADPLTSNGGTLTKIGDGTLILTGANTYTGITTISGGTLQIDNGGGTGSLGTGDVIDNANLTFDLSSNPTVSNNISGTGSITQNGTGTVTLSGTNTYSGATTINTGTLEAGVVDQAFGLASAVSVAVGGTMDLGGFNETIGSLSGAGTVTNSGGSAAVLTTGADNTSTTFSGNIQDGASTVGLTMEGTGTLILSGDNTYSGDTTLNGGTLNLGSSTAIGAGTINFNGGTLQYSVSNTNDYSGQFSAADDQAFNIDTNSQDVTFADPLTSNGGTLTKIGDGTLILTGANTYTGITTISGGTLQIDNGGGTGSLGTGDVIDNANLTFDLSSNPTVSNNISGTGSITQNGTGTVTLSGTNTYSGATTINTGTLEAGVVDQAFGLASAVSVAVGGTMDLGGFNETIGSLSGAGTVTNSGGSAAVLTTGADNTSTTFSGNIQDGASTVGLTMEGTGTLILSGDNTYSGDTTLNGGTLNLGSSTAIGAGTINFNGGTLQYSVSNTNDYSGQFSAADDQAFNIDTNSQDVTFANPLTSNGGTLTKIGDGTLTLNAANAYTGATTINGGTLQTGVSGAIPDTSDVSIAAPGTLDLDGNSGTIGSLSGAGTVTSSSAGAGDIVLTTGDANTTTFSGTIQDSSGTGSGTIDLVTTGTGTLVLSGANAFSGGTDIQSGSTLQVENANALGTGPVTNEGTLALDATSLSLGGEYTQNPGSTLGLTINSSNNYGNITSPSALVDTASAINVHIAGYVPNNAQFEIIDTGGTGIGNSPSTITSDNSLYNFSSAILNGNLFIIANNSSTGFASLADNPNARAIGVVLDNVSIASPDMQTILNELVSLRNSDPAAITSALNTMGPEIDGGVIANSSQTMNNFIGATIDRIQTVLSRNDIINSSLDQVENTIEHTGYASTGVSSGDESFSRYIWAKPYSSYLTQGTRQNIQGYDAWNTGTVVGLDRMITDDFTLGVSGGYAYGRVSSNVNNALTDITSAQGTLYAGYKDPNLNYFIDAAGSFAWNWYNGQRDIVIGPIDRIAYSRYDGQQYGTYLGGGYNINLGNNVKFTPLSSLQWTRLSLGSYSETNANAMDLNVDKQSYDILETGLGASISSQEKYNWGIFTPEFHVKWLYDFINDGMSVTSTFAGGGGSFTANGAEQPKNGADIGSKLTFDLSSDLSLIAECDTELKDGFFGIYGSGTVRYKF